MQASSKRIALVTGATVLLGARSKVAGEEAAAKLTDEGIDTRYVRIDVVDHASVAAAAATVTANYSRLDILVNNAGINDRSDGPAPTASLDAVERVLRTNVLGALAVTQAMLPLLRQSPAARIVNVSSGLGSLTQSGDPAHPSATTKLIGYGASKAALNMLTVHLAYLLRDTAITVNSAAPGFTATDLNDHHGVQTIPEGATEVVRLALLPDDGPTGAFSGRNGVVPW